MGVCRKDKNKLGGDNMEKKRLVIVSHLSKKDVSRVVGEMFGKADILYMDNMAKYDYTKKGWRKELEKRMRKNVSNVEFEKYDEIYFVAVGFIPAVLVGYDVLRDMGVEFDVLTHNKNGFVYEKIEWR